MRVLGRVRLSRDTEESTSVERQRAAIESWAAMHGHEIIGWATDLDVGRSIDPFAAPELGPWLTERLDSWDVVCAWKLDRLATGSVQLNRLFELCQRYGKTLASTSEAIDSSTWVGELVANVIAGVSRGELEAIRERTGNAAQYLVKSGRYRGGRAPWGYCAVKIGDEWRLKIDEKQQVLIHEVARRLLDGERPHAICIDLTERGEPTPAGRSTWRASVLIRQMTSETLLGHVLVRAETGKRDEKGRKIYEKDPVVLRGEDGSPVVRANPVIDADTFRRVGGVLNARKGTRGPYRSSLDLLLQVIFCGVCGMPMYSNPGRSTMYYRCSSATIGQTCGNRSIRVSHADDVFSEMFLAEFGDSERRERVYVPGDDTAQEIAELDEELSAVAEVVGTPGFRSGPAAAKLAARAAALETRREELASRPIREAGYRWEPTGERFAEWWNRLDDRARNQWLRDMHVRVKWTRDERSTLDVEFGDLAQVREAITGTAGTSDRDWTRTRITWG